MDRGCGGRDAESTLQPKVTESLHGGSECEGEWERRKESHKEEKPRQPRPKTGGLWLTENDQL